MPTPTEIKLHKQSRLLEVTFDDGARFHLPCQYLRVSTPAAGEDNGQGTAEVTIDAIEPVGNYAVRLQFSDGHSTGIYTWELLYQLGARQSELWPKSATTDGTESGETQS